MSAGCAVVTENSTDLEPLRISVDLLSGRLEALGLLSAWVAEDHELRTRLVRQADAQIKQYASLARGAATLLAAAERANQAPLDPRAKADVTIANAKSRIYPPPPWEVSNLAAGTVLESGSFTLGDHRILRALKRQQQEMLSFRRQLSGAILSRARPERPHPETLELASTAGWDKLGLPRVSVIVPLYNDKDVVIEALDSVVASTFGPWEIVVVDDASSDGGDEVVRSWMAGHDDRPVALIRHEVNRGLSAARNSGVAKARARLLLMLDSDNLLRPFGMARLVRALAKDPRAAFAYGILDRFREDGPEGLVSEFGWEPRRFRDGNYIDALAMIRREAFEELGGYSEDGRLMLGYEDYDLWARVAERGRWAVFVRQFVASYRVGHSSMLSVTNMSKVDAIAAVAEHAPNLMQGVELQT
jgi:Glycosyl transferase family 2